MARPEMGRTRSADEAPAIVWRLTSVEVHRLLRSERGWTAERYEAWLEATLSGTLLGWEDPRRLSATIDIA